MARWKGKRAEKKAPWAERSSGRRAGRARRSWAQRRPGAAHKQRLGAGRRAGHRAAVLQAATARPQQQSWAEARGGRPHQCARAKRRAGEAATTACRRARTRCAFRGTPRWRQGARQRGGQQGRQGSHCSGKGEKDGAAVRGVRRRAQKERDEVTGGGQGGGHGNVSGGGATTGEACWF
jgi:hypothetical protein